MWGCPFHITLASKIWFWFRHFLSLSIGTFRFLAFPAPRLGYLRQEENPRTSCSLYHYLCPEEPSLIAFSELTDVCFVYNVQNFWLYLAGNMCIYCLPLSRISFCNLLKSFRKNTYVYVSLYVYGKNHLSFKWAIHPDLASIKRQQVLFLKSHTNILDFEGHTMNFSFLPWFLLLYQYHEYHVQSYTS